MELNNDYLNQLSEMYSSIDMYESVIDDVRNHADDVEKRLEYLEKCGFSHENIEAYSPKFRSLANASYFFIAYQSSIWQVLIERASSIEENLFILLSSSEPHTPKLVYKHIALEAYQAACHNLFMTASDINVATKGE